MTRITLFLALTLLASDSFARDGWICDSSGCRPAPKATAAAPVRQSVRQSYRAPTLRERFKARLRVFAGRFAR